MGELTSAAWIRGFQHGYRLAARTAGRSPAYLLLSWLVNLLIGWTVAVILLWSAADIFSRNAAGQPLASVIKVTKAQAWNKVVGPPER